MPQSLHRLRNDLKCVEWDIKPCLIQSNPSQRSCICYSKTSAIEQSAHTHPSAWFNIGTVLPVAQDTFVHLRLQHLVTVVFSTLFINRLTYIPISRDSDLRSWLRTLGTHYHPTLDPAILWTPSNDTSRPICSDSPNLMPPAPLYLRTLWRYTNAVISIIIICFPTPYQAV